MSQLLGTERWCGTLHAEGLLEMSYRGYIPYSSLQEATLPLASHCPGSPGPPNPGGLTGKRGEGSPAEQIGDWGREARKTARNIPAAVVKIEHLSHNSERARERE